MNVPETSSRPSRFFFWFVLSGSLIHAGMWFYFLVPPRATEVAAIGSVGAATAMLGAVVAAWWGIFRAEKAAAWHARAAELLLWLIVLAGLWDLPWRAGMIQRVTGGLGAMGVILPALAACAGVILAVRFAGPRGRYAVLGMFLLVFAVRNYLDITRYPDNGFDVLVFHQEGSDRLLRGTNPFRGPMPIYMPYEIALLIYHPDVVRENYVLQGYVYPPVTLLTGLPGHWLLGEFRMAMLAAFLVMAVLLYRLLPNRLGLLASGAILIGPASRTMLFFGWTETFCALYLVLGACSFLWWPRIAPYVFGLLLGSKQTMVLLLPGLWMFLRNTLPPGKVWVWLGKCFACLLLITLPFVLWSPSDFFFSVISMHLKQPLRTDSASFGTMIFPNTPAGKAITGLVSVALYLAVVAAGYFGGVMRKGLAAWCAWSGLLFMAYFIFNKQAFPNYYFFSWIAMILAAILSEKEQQQPI